MNLKKPPYLGWFFIAVKKKSGVFLDGIELKAIEFF